MDMKEGDIVSPKTNSDFLMVFKRYQMVHNHNAEGFMQKALCLWVDGEGRQCDTLLDPALLQLMEQRPEEGQVIRGYRIK